ncbi:MAG: DUF4445 domain-containing protein [Acidobacteria bacterium]|nr:DUF4445 domain-containing protein [Acidobacteriota bacterium]
MVTVTEINWSEEVVPDSRFTVRFLPFDATVEVASGTTLLDAAVEAGLPVKASCGGRGTCGDCLLSINSGSYRARPSAGLSKNLVAQGYALACTTRVTDNLTVHLPQFQELSIRSVADSGFFNAHKDEVSGYYGPASFSETVADVIPSATDKNIFGIACDVGTTTVVVQLVDLRTGRVLSTASGYNHQLKCGDDIISRIHYAEKPGHLRELNTLIVATINRLIQKNLETIHGTFLDIYYASVSGNTTMTYLLLNMDPGNIRKDPYAVGLNRTRLAVSRNLGLKMNPEAMVLCAPAVGSYVGGDITAGLLCTPLLRDAEKVSLFIDVGTNGELVLGNRDWMVTCACSAGPAFEGSGTKCGMPAAAGAIERIGLDNGSVAYTVIGGGKPKGLCGSGLVDLLSGLFLQGYIDRGGKLSEEKAADRLVETERGGGFLIEKAERSYWEKDLVITENDIANLIRTKGAVFSACSLLLKNVGLAFENLDAVYIAGGFGQYLNIENAISIGLFPDLPRDRFHYLGNSSLLGAYLVLISDKNRDLVNETAGRMTYIELNTEPDYMNEYTGSLFLPHTDMDLFPSVKRIWNQ